LKKNRFEFDAHGISTYKPLGQSKSVPSPYGSEASYAPCGTISDLLDVDSRDEVDVKVSRFLYACGIPFNILCSPCGKRWLVSLTMPLKDIRSPGMRKLKPYY
jgi:hypothetical protein